MSVRKREWTTRRGERKTAWVADYTDQSGARHIETYARKKDADAREAQVRIDVRSGKHVVPTDITVAAAAAAWINGRIAADRERATLHGYRNHVDLHIVPRLGAIKLSKLTAQTVEKFRDELLNGKDGELSTTDNSKPGKALSRLSARKVLSSLKALLKAAKYGHLASEAKIELSKRRRLEVGKEIPTPMEIKRLIDAAKTPRQRALVLTAALTGLRASELRGLRWSDVDLKVGELHVRQRADRYNSIGSPKSRAGNRSIPLPPDLVLALKEWRLKCPKAGTLDLVFPTSTGAVEHHAGMLRSLAPIMRRAGVVERDSGEPKYGLHSFRHFFASWCINPRDRGGRELPPKQAQVLLGHSSIVMTLDTYGHLFREGSDRSELAEAARLLLA
jgi:integrase